MKAMQRRDINNLNEILKYYTSLGNKEYMASLKRAIFLSEHVEEYLSNDICDFIDVENEIDLIISEMEEALSEDNLSCKQDKEVMKSFRNDVFIIGLGECGNNVVERMLSQNRVSANNCLILSGDSNSLSHASVCHTHLLQALSGKRPSGLDTEYGKQAMGESLNYVSNILKNSGCKKVVILCAAGGSFAGGLYDLLIRITSICVDIYPSIFVPFSFESPNRINSANQISKRIMEGFHNVQIVENDDVLKIISRSARIDEAMRVLDDMLLAKMDETLFK